MSRAGPGDAYRSAGVDLEAQDQGLARIQRLVRSTFSPSVLSEVGSFGGLFELDLAKCRQPVLVASADGVGTKLVVARMVGDFSTVGRDLVNHCVNDILVQGGRPLFFLDYVAAGKLEPLQLERLVGGVVRGCKDNGLSLLGGETAEMPGFYASGDYELVGFVVGVVERPTILTSNRVSPGDVLVALPSAGLHTNGFSLARRILFEEQGLGVEDRLPGGTGKVGETLLSPHLSYLKPLTPLLGNPALHGLAHITGGGLTDNLPRVLPEGARALVRVGTWEIPEIFLRLQALGRVDWAEMFRVFNMGVGMVAIVDAVGADEALGELRRSGQRAVVIGTVDQGRPGVLYDPLPGSLAS